MLDADGTRHYFKETSTDNKYEDEEGTGTTIEYRPNESVSKYLVTYKNGFTEEYTGINGSGLSYLVYENDTDGNTIHYQYGGGILSYLEDKRTDGRKITLGRDTGRVSVGS